MIQLIPPERFRKRWKSSDVSLFSCSNRNDRKNPVPFVNSHSTRNTSVPFPTFCHCSRHFDFLLFSPSHQRLGLTKRHTGKILYRYERSIPTGFSVQMVNTPGVHEHVENYLVLSGPESKRHNMHLRISTLQLLKTHLHHR